jgi:hypothetical protein
MAYELINVERDVADRTDSVADGLLARGGDVVTGLLRDNVGRWETLSAADRVRLERLAHRIVERLLHEPALMLDAAERAGDESRLRLARSLFGLSPQTAHTSSRTLCVEEKLCSRAGCSVCLADFTGSPDRLTADTLGPPP